MTPNHKIIIEDNPKRLAARAAEFFALKARRTVEKKGRFLAALSGGSTPRSMNRLLAEEPLISEIPWGETHLYWVDERCVSENDEASNYGAAKRDFLDRVPMPAEQIHPMPGEMVPEEGARQYRDLLRDLFKLDRGQFPIFDLIFLGIGADGHTASLFPGQGALDERVRSVVAVKGGNPDVSRLTLTYPVLNRGAQIVFLVSGRGKAGILQTIFESGETHLPAQRISPVDGTLTWLIDRDAAALLSKGVTHGD